MSKVGVELLPKNLTGLAGNLKVLSSSTNAERQKRELRKEPREAQLLVLVLSAVLKCLFQTNTPPPFKKKDSTHSANMTLLAKPSQTFWLDLTARVQRLSLLSSKTPSLWLCLCKNSTSSCWDVSPVLTADGIKGQEELSAQSPEREETKTRWLGFLSFPH